MEFIFLNPHFIPFIVSFGVGAILLVLAPLSYMARTEKFIMLPWDVLKYNTLERKMLLFGAIATFVGIIGLMVVDTEYGHRTKYTDIVGKTTIIKKFPDGHNRNADFLNNQK